MIKIFAYKYQKDLSLEKINYFWQFLSGEEKSRFGKIRIDKERNIRIVARFILRKILSEYLGLEMGKIKLVLGKYNKPKAMNFKNIDFNVSHAGDWIVIGFCTLGRIGVDIEMIRPIDLEIANKYFHQAEIKSLKKSKDKNKYFFRLWVLKESFIKATGQGLYRGLDNFFLKITDKKVEIKSGEENKKWYFKEYKVSNDYITAACSDRDELPGNINIIHNL